MNLLHRLYRYGQRQSSVALLLFPYLPLWLIISFSLGFGAQHASAKMVKNHVSHVRYCEVCGLRFTKPLAWEQHLAGRAHKEREKKYKPPEAVYAEFLASAPHWATENVSNASFTSAIWNNEELSTLGFKMRATCLHPSSMVHHLKALAQISTTISRVLRTIIIFVRE